ncbi:MAG: hypothetical protein NVSMB4_04000 [Acidimicrobiales bacterium]
MLTRIRTLAAASAVVIMASSCSQLPRPAAATCDGSTSSSPAKLTVEQARNASTIAAVGKRMGVADHGITVALAAALQESKLRNLSGGDRDSAGLFQQRPSQGWGTRTQVRDPFHAATAFYDRLVKVDGWATMAVTDAAQSVQHSAAPDAYRQWEPEARSLARTLSGEVPAGFACRIAHPGTDPTLVATMLRETGVRATAAPGGGVRPIAVKSAAQGWLVASWLVAHADRFPVTTLSYAGFRWVPAAARWDRSPGAGPDITVTA